MSSMSGAPSPAPRSLLDLPLPALSEAADETLRRGRVFLFGVSQGGFLTRALLQGYTESIHDNGVLLFRIGTAERAFAEWREWRALRPPRDPDLPELVNRLTAFRERWLPRALESISALGDEGDRKEATEYIASNTGKPSRTWTAKTFVVLLRHMEGDPVFRPVWAALVARGILDELPGFDQALAEVQDFLRKAPVDEEEVAEIQSEREDAASQLQSWLADRKRELAPVLDEADLVVLGLGDRVPPPFTGASAFLLRRLEITAKA